MKQHWKLCKKLRNLVTSGKANAALKKVNPAKNTSNNPQSIQEKVLSKKKSLVPIFCMNMQANERIFLS